MKHERTEPPRSKTTTRNGGNTNGNHRGRRGRPETAVEEEDRKHEQNITESESGGHKAVAVAIGIGRACRIGIGSEVEEDGFSEQGAARWSGGRITMEL